MKILYNPFTKKKEKEELKKLPFPGATKSIARNLKLYYVSLSYHSRYSEGNKFIANIIYKENIHDVSNPGVIDEQEISANTWPELVEKVSDHFNGIDRD